MNTESNSSSGIGILGILGIVFVTLKLIGVIDWSWWWVTIPFWGGFVLNFAFILAFAIVSALPNRR